MTLARQRAGVDSVAQAFSMKHRSDDEGVARAIMQCRLSRWAAWVRREMDQGQGYPRRANFMIHEVFSGGLSTIGLEHDAECWKTGQAVRLLSDGANQIIKLHWLEPGKQKDKYKALNVSSQKYSKLYRLALDELILKIALSKNLNV